MSWSNGSGAQTGPTAFDDTFAGTPGDDEVADALAGNDLLNGEDGADSLNGGAGNDELLGGQGADTLQGGAGIDFLYGGEGPAGGIDTSGDLLLDLGGGAWAFGEEGNDTIIATIAGSAFDPSAFIEGANLDGGAGDDLLIATGPGFEDFGITYGAVLNGRDGADTILGSDAADEARGEEGADSILAGDGDDTVDGGADDDHIAGGAGADLLSGGDGNDTIEGGAGDDTIEGGAGADKLDGLTDGDVLSYRGDAAGVTVDLVGTGTFTATGGDAEGDTLSGFVHVLGGSGDDALAGTGGANTLDGGEGADTLFGEDGDDTLLGGAGNDSIAGGAGADLATWAAGDGADTLDGGSGVDTIAIEGWAGLPVATAELALDETYGDWTVTAVEGDWREVTNTAGDVLRLTAWEGITCFAEGTRILTSRGEVPVESLRAGDLVVTPGGDAPLRPIRWVGHLRVDIARHRDPARVAPVLIRAGALGAGIPYRDLRVSPDHAVLVQDRLVPARMLLNGETILQERWHRALRYWHVELDSHGVLVAEGAPAESYFDGGNRHVFDPGIVALDVDFGAGRACGRYAAEAFAPPVLDASDPALVAILDALPQPGAAEGFRARHA